MSIEVPRTPVQVVHVLGTIRPSGMERMVQSALPYWSQEGVSTLIVSLGRETSFGEELRASGVEVWHTQPVRTMTTLLDLRRLLRRLRPDVIHVHTESAFALIVGAAKLATPSIPIVRTVHNIFPCTGRDAVSRRIQAKIADRFVGAFVAPSEDVAISERKLGRNPIVIENWVDEKYSSFPSARRAPDEPLAVIVGNASVIKNQHIAIWAAIQSRTPIAYHGSETEAPPGTLDALQTASERGLLRYRGTNEPFESLRRATVFAMPSLREGMSVALLEALAMRVPCLISDVPGQRWARAFDNVVLLPPLDQAVWTSEFGRLNNARSVAIPPQQLPFSLHPERGALDYSKLYRRIISKPQEMR